MGIASDAAYEYALAYKSREVGWEIDESQYSAFFAGVKWAVEEAKVLAKIISITSPPSTLCAVKLEDLEKFLQEEHGK